VGYGGIKSLANEDDRMQHDELLIGTMLEGKVRWVAVRTTDTVTDQGGCREMKKSPMHIGLLIH
jgi:hypothetical protein